MNAQCVLVQAAEAEQGRTGVTYAAGISSGSAGARGLCLQLASLPPGARARAHRHDTHESAAYVIEGEMVLWFGEQLEQQLVARPGDFIYIPNGVPHLVANASDDEPAVAVLARTDANAQEDVTELPALDSLAHLPVGTRPPA
ncbi:MAG: cupin domain-containing protein [Solirubrobacteraceae bacterium]